MEPGADLQTSIITQLSQLEDIAQEWSDLLARSESNEPMSGPLWLVNWWRVYGTVQRRALCVLLVRRDDRLVGLVPLCRRPVRVASVPLQRLELLGTGEAEADETCSEYIGIVAERGEEQAVANAFGEALRRGDLSPWDELVLTSLSSEAVTTPLTLLAIGPGTRYHVLGGAPFVRLPATWDDYLAALPSSRRALIRKSLRQWESWAKAPPVLRQVEREEELDTAFEMLSRLHAERWQDAGHVGAFDSPLFARFHKQTMRDLLRANALWLCWLEVAGEPVAALYSIVWNNQVRFYQSGRTVDVPKKVRAGLVIHACAIRHAIESGYSHYDFLAGTSRYKMQLANDVRPLVRLSIAQSSARLRLRNFGNTGIRIGQRLRESWRDRRGDG